jgi:invasion protein IalB
MSKHAIATGVIAALGVLASERAFAQAPAPAVQVDASGWTVQCASNAAALDCKASQELRLKGTRQLLVSTIVNIARDTKQPTMLIQLAHGMFLPAGATLQLGKRQAQRLDIQTCDAGGCYAGLAIPKDMLMALQSEQEMTVTFQDLQKRPITVHILLADFSAAFQKLQ